MTHILGFDLSLNHGAVVELWDGELRWFSYYTTHAKTAGMHKNGCRLELPKTLDKERFQMARLAWTEKWIRQMLTSRRPAYVGIEGYAYHMQQGSHQLGEVGGAARLLCWKHGVRFRLHDPRSVKLFVAHDGTAQKDLIRHSVKKRWGVSFSKVDPPRTPKGNRNRTSSEDLADAYGIARLIDTEIHLRSGALQLKDLEHDKERQVFNRVTKMFPVSLLGREWIHNQFGNWETPPRTGGPLSRKENLRVLLKRHRPLVRELLAS